MRRRVVGTNFTDKEIIHALADKNSASMKVIGRGTLVIDTKDIIDSNNYKKIANQAKDLVK